MPVTRRQSRGASPVRTPSSTPSKTSSSKKGKKESPKKEVQEASDSKDAESSETDSPIKPKGHFALVRKLVFADYITLVSVCFIADYLFPSKLPALEKSKR